MFIEKPKIHEVSEVLIRLVVMRARAWLTVVLIAIGSLGVSVNAQQYVWRTLAGAMPGGADGVGDQAQFYYPYGMTSDAGGNLYVADDLNHTVRKVLPNGAVTTIAGKAGSPGVVNGMGPAARFNRPSGVAVDRGGNVYVCDRGNHCIRKIAPSGEVTTFVGSLGAAGDADGSATQARFRQPRGIAVDANDIIYIADTDNHTIRKILPDGTVSTLAGLALTTGSSDGSGNLARFNLPTSLCVSSSGDLFVTDASNYTIRKVTPAGEVTTFAGSAGQSGNVNGNGAVARFARPNGVCATGEGVLFVSDTFNQSIRKVTSSGDVTTFSGAGAGWIDGPLDTARFWAPIGIAVTPNGEICISDSSNCVIRRIDQNATITTLAGRPIWGDVDGSGLVARFNFANSGAVAVGLSGGVYIADNNNFVIRQIQGSEVITVAGVKDGTAATVDGAAMVAKFSNMHGIACDALGNVYVSQGNSHQIRKLSIDGQVITAAGALNSAGANDGTGSGARFRAPIGLATDAFNRILIADRDNHAIRRMTPQGDVTTIAGTIGTTGTANGPALSARFNGPQAVAVDPSGIIYVADTNNHCIRRITLDANVETFAGLVGTSGYIDGPPAVARFNSPVGVATDTLGNVFVADGNARIRKITPSGETSTIGGGTVVGYNEGIGASALFQGPARIAVDSEGLVYVPDIYNNRIVVGGVMPFQEVLSPELIVLNGAEGVISFGQSILGRTSTKEITLKNRGTAALDVQCAFSGTNASEFILAGGASTVSVPAGSELKLTIQHTPLGQQGERAASLRLTSNDVIQPDLMIALGSTAIDAKPVFNLSPANETTRDPGQSVTFAAMYVSGLEPFTYRWRRNSVFISGATDSSYNIANTQQSHEGSYDCVITNAYGSFTTSATVLDVNDPVVIVGAPLGRAANVNEEVTFTVTALGTPPLSYQWRKNGVVLPGETAVNLSFFVGPTSGGFYDAVVTNPLGSVASTTAALTVLTPPIITLQPTDQAIAVGGTAFFSVVASGPALSYQWRRNGVDLKGQIAPMLIIANSQWANEGVYDVVIRNSFGAALSQPARLSLPAPLIITQQPEGIITTRGATASFNVAAVGSGVLTYQWLKDGKAIKGATAATLIVPVMAGSVAGTYSVVVSSGKLKATSRSAQLRVEDKGLLIYRFTVTGSAFAGTMAANVKLAGLLVLDRVNQRGGILRFAKDGKLDTFLAEVDDGLRTHSTGPVPNSQTVVRKLAQTGESPDEEAAVLWLRGTDGVVAFSVTDRTVAPKTLNGFQTELRINEGTEVESLSVTATLDVPASLQARQAQETVEQTLSRLSADLQQKGFIREEQ